MTSKILLEGVKIYAFHGAIPEEQLIGTYFITDLEVHVDFWKSTESDQLEDTISYADLNEIIHQEMSTTSQLIEHVAGRILKSVHRKFPQITFVKVKVSKTNPPKKGSLKSAAVVLEQSFN